MQRDENEICRFAAVEEALIEERAKTLAQKKIADELYEKEYTDRLIAMQHQIDIDAHPQVADVENGNLMRHVDPQRQVAEAKHENSMPVCAPIIPWFVVMGMSA